MAKYERVFSGNFDQFIDQLHKDILGGSMSATYEDGSDLNAGNLRLAVRVYERYSMAGGNRVSLSITLLGNGNDLFLTAITSGGSQAMFFKFNTFGEHTFLDQCADAVERYIEGGG